MYNLKLLNILKIFFIFKYIFEKNQYFLIYHIYKIIKYFITDRHIKNFFLVIYKNSVTVLILQ